MDITATISTVKGDINLKLFAEETPIVANSIAQGDTINSITINGDTSEHLTQMKDRIDEWNNILG